MGMDSRYESNIDGLTRILAKIPARRIYLIHHMLLQVTIQ